MHYYIGWDVGGWNCDHAKSQDALCVLKGTWDNLNLTGEPWRGNLREVLVAECGNLATILQKVKVKPEEAQSVTWAIDTPLGWPKPFCELVLGRGDPAHVPPRGNNNPYLFRRTEQWIAQQGPRCPLSAVRDKIGSQSTKGIYFLRRCGFERENIGIWKAGGHTAIETYPTPVRGNPRAQGAFAHLQSSLSEQSAAAGINALSDVQDSLWCALIAAMFAIDREGLYPPERDVSAEEGWIWIPK
jgi:hypothetical protein